MLTKRNRIGAGMGVATLVTLGLAAWMRGPGWLLLWPATAFGWVSASYLLVGAAGFGKRRDGTISPTVRLVAGPFLGILSLVRRVQEATAAEPPYQRVSARLFLGRHPRSVRVPDPVTIIVDLTAEFPSDAQGRRLEVLPCLDGAPPSASQLQRILELYRNPDEVLYVHCAAGHGRSATAVVFCLLAVGEERDIGEAERRLQVERPGVRLAPEQKAQILASLRHV